MDEDGKAPSTLPEKENPVSMTSNTDPGAQVENVSASDGKSSNNSPHHTSSEERISSDQVKKVAESMKSMALAGNDSENKGRF